jgi:hypothetical protein
MHTLRNVDVWNKVGYLIILYLVVLRTAPIDHIAIRRLYLPNLGCSYFLEVRAEPLLRTVLKVALSGFLCDGQ